MDRSKLYISTTASDASDIAKQYGLGIEIAEYCTAWNMDDHFDQTDLLVREKLDGIERRVLHAPFNELFPCAIDRKARELAAFRYRQALRLAERYGATKLVIHGGYNEKIYYPVWYVEQSIVFWKDFLEQVPGVEIVLENVLETDDEWLVDIIKEVDDSRLRLCLDVGHVNAYSAIPVMEWLKNCTPCISHFHLHNNDGSWDSHAPLHQGGIPMKDFIREATILCPDATFTLELREAESSVRWLADNELI